jgi:hypothetical protein
MLKKEECTYESALYMYANTAVYYIQIQVIRLTLYLAALGHAKRVFKVFINELHQFERRRSAPESGPPHIQQQIATDTMHF